MWGAVVALSRVIGNCMAIHAARAGEDRITRLPFLWATSCWLNVRCRQPLVRSWGFWPLASIFMYAASIRRNGDRFVKRLSNG